MIYKGFYISYVNETKNNFWLKILKKYYLVVGVIADETDLQMFHVYMKLSTDEDFLTESVLPII